MDNFVSRLSSLREAHNTTLATLATAIDVSLRALKYYSAGQREPSLSTLIALADYFGVSLDYLVGRSDDPTLHR